MSLTGMIIVFAALTIISFIIAMLPRILSILERYYPEAVDHHWVPHVASEEEAVVAAIVYSIHQNKSS